MSPWRFIDTGIVPKSSSGSANLLPGFGAITLSGALPPSRPL